jgi:uncharacterized protein
MRAGDLIEQLALRPHPEGGWYREIHRSAIRVDAPTGSRAALTTIYYLLEREQLSRWHVVAADEVWHFYFGAPLELLEYDPAMRKLRRRLLTVPCEAGGEPVAVIRRDVWQAARSLGDFTLVGCSVGPGFEFEDFRFVASLPEHASHFIGPMQPLTGFL